MGVGLGVGVGLTVGVGLGMGLGVGAGVVDCVGVGAAVVVCVGLVGTWVVDAGGLGGLLVCVGDVGADQGGDGVVEVVDAWALGNHSVIGSEGLGLDRDGSCVRFPWVGVVVTPSGVLPKGRPTGDLVAVPSFGVVFSDVVFSDSVGAGGLVVVADSRPPNGTKTSSPASASTVATRALILTTGGPPYRPIGPRTGSPSWSTQNAQPAGGLGQEESGVKFFGGRHRTFGGSGQPGGGLNCLKRKPFRPQADRQPTHLSV